MVSLLYWLFPWLVAAPTFVLRSNNNHLVNTTIELSRYALLGELLANECPLLLGKGGSAASCVPEFGARVVDQFGGRVLNLSTVVDGSVLHMVFAGTHFVYHQPLNVSFKTDSGLTLKQISYTPRLFEIEELVFNNSQIASIVSRSAPLVRPSTVVTPTGPANNRNRTSFNTFDGDSPEYEYIGKKAMRLLAMDYSPDLVEYMQVVRYLPGEYYLPHTDFFQTGDGFSPNMGNGSNRFATLFIYLNDVQSGGETMFPLSKQIVDMDWGLEKFRDNCVPDANHISMYPKKGRAILFYSQHPDGSFDPHSYHGACPPSGSVKWAANLWIWNRPQVHLEDICRVDAFGNSMPVSRSFSNPLTEVISIYWVSNWFGNCDLPTSVAREHVFNLKPSEAQMINTYLGHVFLIYGTDDKLLQCFVLED